MNKKKSINSIDGISGHRSRRFDSSPKSEFSSKQTKIDAFSDQKQVNQTTNSISNFQRKDGFYPSADNLLQSRSRLDNTPIDDTLVVENSKKSRKRFFLFGKTHEKSLRKKWSLKRKIITTVVMFFVVLLIVAGLLFAKGYFALHKVFRGGGGAVALEKNVDPSKLSGEGDGRVNILLLGRGGEGHDGADLTDTIILASIDPVNNDAALLSIPRDLYVKTSKYGSTKINAVFALAKQASMPSRGATAQQQKTAEADGFKAIESTITDTMGVPIHYHLMVDFAGFQQAVDNVGGVDINAPTSVAEMMYIQSTGKNFYLNVKAGNQHMDGLTALAYARSRHTSPRGDFDRAERQRALITALKDKIISPSTFSNPQKISNLISTFGNHVQTNFTVQDLQRLAQISKQIPPNKITSLGLADPPNNYVTTSNIGGLSVVVPTAGISNYKDIQFFVRNALKDSYIKNENASIMVLNGTTKAGLAGERGQDLKSFGYNITKVDNAPTKSYTKTVIVDMRGGAKKYTKNYLEKRFGVTTVSTIPDPTIIPDSTTDFVIILGSDQVN